MTIDLLDVLAVDWVRITNSADFPVYHRRVVLARDVGDDELRQVLWRDSRGAMWAVVRTERSNGTTTIYFAITD